MIRKAKSNQIQRLLALVLAVCTVGVNTATLSVATEGGVALPVCGMTEHAHGPDCVTTESTLTCGLEAGSVHTHDASCQELQKTLICQLTEEEAHQHSEECNTVTDTLTCTLNETEAHSHSEQCYPVTLTCGLEDFSLQSEQYYIHVDPAVKVYATTKFPVFPGPHDANGEIDLPVVYTKLWGKGKVYYNSLGHTYKVFRDIPQAKELMRRGLLWAAR